MTSIQAETGLNYTKLNPKTNITPHTELRLSVQISLHGLSFLITTFYTKETVFFTNKKFNTAQTPEELLIHITKIINQNTDLFSNFNEVVLLYQTNAYTIVPTALFDATKASEYLKFTVKILATDFVAHDQTKQTDLTVVYIPFVNINNFFFEKYGSFKYFHNNTILLDKLLQTNKFSKETKVYLNVDNTFFDTVVIKEGALQLCNTFEYNAPEDFIYYVLFVYEQLRLDPNTIPCILLGDISKNDEIYQLLYTYVKDVHFFKPLIESNVTIEETPPYRFFALKNSV